MKDSGRPPKKFSCANLDYVELVDIVRKSRDQSKSESAFREIEKRMQGLIRQISYKFEIPGNERTDTYQEALVALRFKAIKDYDKSRGNGTGPYPFEKFAKLCIVRHLSTKLKASYQNKKKPWLNIVSLSQPRPDENDESLYLMDIVPNDEVNILEAIADHEHSTLLFQKLKEKLSSFELEVLKHYAHKNSYEIICEKINSILPRKDHVKVKSVDNALSRIKSKGRAIYQSNDKDK